MNFLCQVGFTDKGYRCVFRNGFEGETWKGIEPYNNRLTPGVWRVLWISSDYGDDGIGAKSKKFPTVSNTPPPHKKINGLKINPPPARAKHNNNNNNNNSNNNKKQTELRGRHTRAPSDCQTTQENICQIFLPSKISESKNSSLKISSDSSRHLKSRVTSPASPSPSRVLDFDTVLCVSAVFKIRNRNPFFFCIYLRP